MRTMIIKLTDIEIQEAVVALVQRRIILGGVQKVVLKSNHAKGTESRITAEATVVIPESVSTAVVTQPKTYDKQVTSPVA